MDIIREDVEDDEMSHSSEANKTVTVTSKVIFF